MKITTGVSDIESAKYIFSLPLQSALDASRTEDVVTRDKIMNHLEMLPIS